MTWWAYSLERALTTAEATQGSASKQARRRRDGDADAAGGSEPVLIPRALRNIIPANRISPIAQKILAFLPAPTRAGLTSNFEKPTSQTKSIDQFDIKTDYVIGPNDRMFVRYSYQTATVFDPGLYGLSARQVRRS